MYSNSQRSKSVAASPPPPASTLLVATIPSLAYILLSLQHCLIQLPPFLLQRRRLQSIPPRCNNPFAILFCYCCNIPSCCNAASSSASPSRCNTPPPASPLLVATSFSCLVYSRCNTDSSSISLSLQHPSSVFPLLVAASLLYLILFLLQHHLLQHIPLVATPPSLIYPPLVAAPPPPVLHSRCNTGSQAPALPSCCNTPSLVYTAFVATRQLPFSLQHPFLLFISRCNNQQPLLQLIPYPKTLWLCYRPFSFLFHFCLSYTKAVCL